MKKLTSFKLSLIIFLILFTPIFNSCGNQNLFASLKNENQKDKAQDAIVAGDYATAIGILEPYVTKNPSDTQAIGMLGTSYMLSAGFNLLNIAVAISNANSTSKNNFQAILKSMPSGTQGNISYMTKAVNILNTIPAAQRTSEQNYQLALAQAGLSILIIKADCLDSSGNISTSMTNSMSTSDATTVYNNLQSAQTNLSSSGISAGTGSGSALLANLINQINNTAGASNPAKVMNFIISQE